jgi:hypothetical protein
MKKLQMILLALFLVIGVSAAGHATPMSDLLQQGGSITVGDKLFSEWSYDVLADDANNFNVNLIDVVGLNGDPMNPGLLFTTNGAFQVNDLDELDVEISFSVTVLDPSKFIKDVSLGLTGYTFGVNNVGGAIAIGEDVYTDTGDQLFSFDPWVEADNLSGTQTLSAGVNFEPQRKIKVVKDIALFGDDSGDFVSLDSFEQHFSQTTVPEPSTMLLLGAGLLGLCGVTRKKRG